MNGRRKEKRIKIKENGKEDRKTKKRNKKKK